MYMCQRCGKGTQVGMNVSHANNKTKKRSLPNLHAFRFKIGGMSRKAWFCTKCLRIVKAEAATVKQPQKETATAS